MIYFLFGAGITLVFYLDFKLISLLLRRSATYFNENKKNGKGVVVGYDASEGSRWYSLMVRVVELNNNKTYICNSAKINIHEYPVGSSVDVVYVISKKGRVQVYLADRLPADEAIISRIFGVAANVFLWITIGLLIGALITILK